MSTIASFPNRASLGLSLIVALGCGVLALGLALQHPLSPLLAAVAVLAAGAAAARWWIVTPLPLLALMPLIGLAPWTGWITFEELDMLVLATAAGGYLALSLRLPPQERVPAWRRALQFSGPVLVLMALFACSLVLSMERGFDDAGGFVWGWFQGYHESMNSVRLTKSFFEVLLLLPLWVQAGQGRPVELTRSLQLGMTLALVGVCAAAVWERSVNTGLLDFSSDYRSTALFWEMHVGGAALDGCLALTVPFAVLALLRARGPRAFVLLLVLTMASVYVSLTTFSRGVYVAVPVAAALMVQLRGAQRRRASNAPGASKAGLATLTTVPPLGKLGALILIGSFGAAALAMFETSGYRGLMALLGAMFMLLAMPASAWLPSPAQRATAIVGGALMAGVVATLCWALSEAIPKIAYGEYLIALAVTVLLRWRDRPGAAARPLYLILLSAGWFWLMAQVVIVANNWGGPRASDVALLCVLPLTLLWPLMLAVPALWPFKAEAEGMAAWRSRGLLFAVLLLLGAAVAVLGGGAYMRGRMAGTEEDMGVRIQHWKEGYWMLKTPGDFLFGKGLGRYVSNHFFMGAKEDQTGDYHVRHDAGERSYLVLTGGKHMLGWGEMLRVTQRIAPPEGQVTLRLRARAPRDTVLHTEICEKHLLYASHCLNKDVALKMLPTPRGAPQPWQDFKLDLGDGSGFGGPWYWPKLVAFSMALDTPGGLVEIASADLRDARGTPMLANGDFDEDMARWFFSSDKNHLPWHIKNLGMDVLFDQGVVGLVLFGAMLLLGLWRTCLGHGRDHPIAPALAGSLVGFVGIGAFDSLLDVPRVAFMFYVVLAFALGVRALPGAVAERR